VVALLLLIAATWVLPGRMKWYVLTAGLAIIAYEGFLRVTNKRALREADAQAKELRERADALNKRRTQLEEDVTTLNQELANNKAKFAELAQQANELSQRGAAARDDFDKASEEVQRQSAENQQLLEHLQSNESLLATLDEATHAMDELDAAQKSEQRP
jgi:uncharacterized coiled-coil DUF342 family protein